MIEKWLDFTAYGLNLYLAKTPNKHYLVLRGDTVVNHEAAAVRLNFKRAEQSDNVMTRAVHPKANGDLSDSDTPSLRAYAQAFPNVREIPYDTAAHFRDQSKAKTVPKAALQMQPPVRSLGLNRSGQEVFEAANGRFVKNERGTLFAESESAGAAPAMFLRATNAETLAACADGFVEQAYRSKILRAEDLRRFVEVVYPTKVASDSEQALEAKRAVEAATARALVRKGGTGMSTAFIAAARLLENLAVLWDGRGAGGVGPAAPIAVAAQRLLGTESNLKGKRVVLVNPGYGHVFSHLPRTVDLRLAGNVMPAETAMMLTATGLKAETIREDNTALMTCDAQVADLPRTVGKPIETAAGRLVRADLATALALLEQRDADGNSVLLLDAPTTPGEAKEFEAFRDHVSQRYAFDGESTVDGSLWRGRPDAPGKVMMSIGWRRPRVQPNALPPEPRDIRDWSGLWTWTAEVVVSRAQIERDSEETTTVDVSFTSGTESRNEYQVPYVSASRTGSPTTMVPRNLEGSTREALARVVKTHGDVDALVAKEFGYEVHELPEIFSPEQIDALALYVHADGRGRGFLLADQMGVGKGRTLAAIMRRSILRGENVLSLTERQTNFSDIWRDIVHTRSERLFKPMFVNNGAAIIDERTKQVVMRTAPIEDINAMLDSGAWPDGFNAVFATYSQFTSDLDATGAAPGPAEPQEGNVAPTGVEATASRRKSTVAKSQWLSTAVDKGVKMVLDESHNGASGESNVSKNLTRAVKQSGGVAYGSATFAHKAVHMAFYAPLLPDDMSSEDLAMMLERGGETFQEVLAAMLVQDGVMIRREFDLSKLTIETILDSDRVDRNCAYMDAIAPIFREMVSLSADVDGEIRRRNAAAVVRRDVAEAPAGEAPPADAFRRKQRRAALLSRSGYGAPLYTISRLFIASLKVEKVVEEALKTLDNDEKPVILVDNTIQSLLEEIAVTEGDADSEEGTQVPDFRVLFNKVLHQMTVAKTGTGEARTKTDLAKTSQDIAAKVDRIKRMIEGIPHLPVSAIDQVKDAIEARGWTVGEITGRTLEVKDGKVMRRVVPSTTVVKNDFNSGALDVVIINTAGSTGIDLHSSERFEDSRPRHMLELQAPANIVKKIQAHGRVNRYDQLHDPKITAFLTGLPMEMRLSAMENAKLRRLSANTTSNRDAAILTRNIPDLINPIGDTVCARYAEARPDLMRMLGFKVSEIDEMSSENLATDALVDADLKRLSSRVKKANPRDDRVGQAAAAKAVGDQNRTANEILARLVMLPVALQKRICTELTAEFYAAVEELEARGETPLKTHELPGIVHIRKDANGKEIRTPFEGAEIESPDSVFNEPLYMVEAALERTGTPIKGDVLLQMVAIGEMASGRMRTCVDRLRNGIMDVLQSYLPESIPSVEEALARNYVKVVDRKAKLERLVATLEILKPGSEVAYTVDGQALKGIVTKVEYPDSGLEHVPGAYGVEFVIPGDEKARSMRLETLMRDEAFNVGDGLGDENYDPILKRYDDAVHVKLTAVQLLTNNIYRGMKMTVEHGLGTLRTFRVKDGTKEGTLHRGIVVSNRHRGLTSIPVEITGAEMAIAALKEGIEICADARLSDKTLSLRRIEGDNVEIRLPPKTSRKYGYVYDEQSLNNLVRRDLSGGKGTPRVQVPNGDVKGILDSLHMVGARFWCGPLNRKWSTQWLTENQKALAPKAPAIADYEPEEQEMRMAV